MTLKEAVEKMRVVTNGPATYMDIYLANTASVVLDRPETEVLTQLREHIAWYAQKLGGRDRWKKSTVETCDSFVLWVNDCNKYDVSDMLSFVANHNPLCVYAVLAGQRLTAE